MVLICPKCKSEIGSLKGIIMAYPVCLDCQKRLE